MELRAGTAGVRAASAHGRAAVELGRVGKAVAKVVAAGGTTLVGTDNPIGYGNFGQVIAISAMAHTGLSNYRPCAEPPSSPPRTWACLNRARHDPGRG